MGTVPVIEQVIERVDRLLLRHEELQRTNALLTDQLRTLTQERDALKSRLTAARQRIEQLLDKVPANVAAAAGAASEANTAPSSAGNGAGEA